MKTAPRETVQPGWYVGLEDLSHFKINNNKADSSRDYSE
jgi:hypothetical protein